MAFEMTSSAYIPEPDVDKNLMIMLSVARFIEKYIDPCLYILGIIGNAIAALIFYKNANHHTALFLSALSVSDFGQNVAILTYWAHESVILSINPYLCQVLVYLIGYFAFVSPWLLTTMTLEKFIAVRFPLSFRHLRTKKILVRIICSDYIIAFLAIVPLVFTVHTNNGTCHIFVKQSKFNLVYNWMLMSFHFLIPFCILSVFNVLIIHAVRKSRQTVLEFSNNDNSTYSSTCTNVGKNSEAHESESLDTDSTSPSSPGGIPGNDHNNWKNYSEKTNGTPTKTSVSVVNIPPNLQYLFTL